MRRRDFTIGLSLAAAMQSARAQEPVKQHRIAIVIAAGPRFAPDSLLEEDGFELSVPLWGGGADRTRPSLAPSYSHGSKHPNGQSKTAEAAVVRARTWSPRFDELRLPPAAAPILHRATT